MFEFNPPNRLSTFGICYIPIYTVPTHHHHHHSKETSENKDNGVGEVTPEQQANLRANIAKERKGKKGRPAAKSKSKAKEKKPVGRPKKTENPKRSKGDCSQQKPKEKGEVEKGPKKSPKGVKKPQVNSTKKRSNEDLDVSGGNDGTEPRVLGCSRCRYANKGCLTCRNPLFRPRRPRVSK